MSISREPFPTFSTIFSWILHFLSVRMTSKLRHWLQRFSRKTSLIMTSFWPTKCQI